jgi:thioredoxin reductase
MTFFAHASDPSADELEQLRARGIDTVSGLVARLVVEADRLTGVQMADRSVVPRTAVFIRPLNVPRADGLPAAIGCDLDAAGFAIVDATGRTSVPGVWAAGNVVDPRLQVISSAGAGSMAAIAINADLVADDVALASEHRDDGTGRPSERQAGTAQPVVGRHP